MSDDNRQDEAPVVHELFERLLAPLNELDPPDTWARTGTPTFLATTLLDTAGAAGRGAEEDRDRASAVDGGQDTDRRSVRRRPRWALVAAAAAVAIGLVGGWRLVERFVNTSDPYSAVDVASPLDMTEPSDPEKAGESPGPGKVQASQARFFAIELEDGSRLGLRLPSIVGQELTVAPQSNGGELLAEFYDGEVLSGAIFLRGHCEIYERVQPEQAATTRRGLVVEHLPYPASDAFTFCRNQQQLTLSIKGDDALADHLDEFDILPLVCGDRLRIDDRWTAPCQPDLFGPVTVADSSGRELVVSLAGWDGGVVTALDAATLAHVWTAELADDARLSAVFDDRLVVIGRTEMAALKLDDGAELWHHQMDADLTLLTAAGSGAGSVLYTLGNFQGEGWGVDRDERAPLLYAHDVGTGRELWRAEGDQGLDWMGDELVVSGDLVIVIDRHSGGELRDNAIWVFDRDTGDQIARHSIGPSGTVGVTNGGILVTDQGIFVSGLNETVTRLDATTGDLLWQTELFGYSYIESVDGDTVNLHHDESDVDGLPDLWTSTSLDLETGDRR